MNNRHDPDHLSIHLVNETIARMRNDLSSASDNADRANFGVLGDPGYRFSEAAIHFEGYSRVYGV
jgi:hypothetical protein